MKVSRLLKNIDDIMEGKAKCRLYRILPQPYCQAINRVDGQRHLVVSDQW